MTQHTFSVSIVSCGHCANAIRSSALDVDSVYSVEVNLDSKEITVKHDGVVNTGAMPQAIQDAGYAISGQRS